jgi:hypothetical protein
MKTKVAHTTIRNQNFFCNYCGGEFIINYPVEMIELINKIKSFNALHKDCKPPDGSFGLSKESY